MDTNINNIPQKKCKNLQLTKWKKVSTAVIFFISFCSLKFKRQNLLSTSWRMLLLIRIQKDFFSPFFQQSLLAVETQQVSHPVCDVVCMHHWQALLAYKSYIAIIQPIQRLQSTKVVCSLIFLIFQHRFLHWIPTNKQTTNNSLTHSLTHHPTDQPTNSMEQSPSWEANRFSASKESPCILNSLTKYVCHSESNASYLFPLKLQQIQGAQ